MKNFRSLFFTVPAKFFYSAILIVLAFLIGECQVEYFNYYAEDNESFVNAMAQIDSFDYETSRYYKNKVKKTVENIVTLSMDYSEIFESDADEKQLLSYFNSIGDSTFSEIHRNLSSMKGFRFAVVNHSKKKIYSNIAEINGQSSAANIQQYFGQPGKNLMIVRSCHNPYFATDTFVEFAEGIRHTAEKYEDNFDLYIYLGTQESFEEDEKSCEALHFEMRQKIEKLNDTVAVYCIAAILVVIILMTVTGKHEPGGKTYPTAMNRLPSDMILLLYGILLICLLSLYRSDISMLTTYSSNGLNEFWFTRSREFYNNRIKWSAVFFISTATNLLGILKRQYKMGMLFKNTYLHTLFENIKKMRNK